MHHQRCVCPRCGTTLRVKDRTYLNRPVPCPHCRTLLVFQAGDNEDRLDVVLAEPPAESQGSAQPPAPTRPALARRFRELATSVTVVSWTVTLLVAAMIVTVAAWPKRRSPKPNLEPVARAERTETKAVEPQPALDFLSDQAESDSAEKVEPQPVDVLPAPVETIVATPEAVEPDDEPADADLAVAAVALLPAAPELPPAVDFDAALSQPLAAFRQVRSVSRRELLELAEELLGAPIRYDEQELGPVANALDQKLSFELEDITVGDVIRKVLETTELTWVRERDGLRLQRTAAEPPEPKLND